MNLSFSIICVFLLLHLRICLRLQKFSSLFVLPVLQFYVLHLRIWSILLWADFSYTVWGVSKHLLYVYTLISSVLASFLKRWFFFHFMGVLSCFSHVQLFTIPRTVTCQPPLSMRFSWEEDLVGCLCPPLGIFPTQRLNMWP